SSTGNHTLVIPRGPADCTEASHAQHLLASDRPVHDGPPWRRALDWRAEGPGVLRPQQGPVQEARFPGAQDRALRHLLLSGRTRGHRHQRAARRAVARAAREAAAAHPQGAPGENGAERLPLWFIEGMAEYLSLGPVDPNTAMWLRDAARENKLPSIDDLDNPKYFPYRWGQAFWAYVGGKWGDEVIPQMLRI